MIHDSILLSVTVENQQAIIFIIFYIKKYIYINYILRNN